MFHSKQKYVSSVCASSKKWQNVSKFEAKLSKKGANCGKFVAHIRAMCDVHRESERHFAARTKQIQDKTQAKQRQMFAKPVELVVMLALVVSDLAACVWEHRG